MRSCSTSVTDVVPSAKAPEVPLDRRRQAEIVEQRRMQQVREVADRCESPIRDRPRIVQELWSAAACLDGALRHRQLHLDRREHLSDLVVQFTGNAPTLFLLSRNQLGGQTLQLAGILHILQPLLSNPRLEAAGIEMANKAMAKLAASARPRLSQSRRCVAS